MNAQDCYVSQEYTLLQATGDPEANELVSFVQFHNFSFFFAEVKLFKNKFNVIR